jgi:4-hydroxybenzoate polyprenyltransferase
MLIRNGLNMYSMLRHASIDILAGVACMYLFAIRILDVSLQLPILFTLVLSTWVIYTIDHILDAYKLRESIIKERYTWHRKNLKVLIWLIAVSCILILLSVLFLLSPDITLFGVLAGVLVIIYFLLQGGHNVIDNRYIYKEVWIGVVYMVCVCGIPILQAGKNVGSEHYLIFLNLYLLVQTNVFLYSWYESNIDIKEGLQTLATKFGKKACGDLITLFLLLSLMASLTILVWQGPEKLFFWPVIIMLSMNLMLGVIRFSPGYFNKNDRYGKYADLVFVFPVVMLLF